MKKHCGCSLSQITDNWRRWGSTVYCLGCGWDWTSDAQYVKSLPVISPEERERLDRVNNPQKYYGPKSD